MEAPTNPFVQTNGLTYVIGTYRQPLHEMLDAMTIVPPVPLPTTFEPDPKPGGAGGYAFLHALEVMGYVTMLMKSSNILDEGNLVLLVTRDPVKVVEAARAGGEYAIANGSLTTQTRAEDMLKSSVVSSPTTPLLIGAGLLAGAFYLFGRKKK